MSYNADDIIRTIAELETTIMNSGEIYALESILPLLQHILPVEERFDFFFREERRFAKATEELDPEWLYFGYLSFSFENGKIRRFTAPDEVYRLLRERQAIGGAMWEKQRKTLICLPDGENPSLLRIGKRIAKLMLSFYYACGTHDHFIASISRRHTTSYMSREFNRDPGLVAQYCEGAYDVLIAFVFLSDSEGEYETLVDRHAIMPKLMKDCYFAGDFRDSVKRKAQRLGTTSDGKWNYLVHTMVEEAFEAVRHGKSGKPFAPGRRGTVIVARQQKRLPLDVSIVIPAVFAAHRLETTASDRDDFLHQIQEAASRLEDKFATSPPEVLQELNGEINNELTRIMTRLTEEQRFDWCQLAALNSFSLEMDQIVAVTPQGIERQVRRSHQPLAIQRYAIEQSEAVYIENREKWPGNGTLDREALFDSGIPNRIKSVLVCPIIVGRICFATLTVGARLPRFLDTERDYLRAVANMIGEFIRRIELVSDLAWMSRLSFLHAARHELQKLQTQLPSPFNRVLRGIIDKHSGLNAEEIGGGTLVLRYFVEELNDTLRRENIPTQVLFEFTTPNVLIQANEAVLVREIVDQLIANAKGHAVIEKDKFHFVFRHGRTRQSAVFVVRYENGKGSRLVPPSLLPRLCVSPTPDPQSKTYHFGLFLCAAQTRMLGGRGEAFQPAEGEVESIPLRLCFQIPMTVSYRD